MHDDDLPSPPAQASPVAALLATSEALAGDAALAEIATRLFEFTQFLLDDDENLTKVGNLDGEARARLQARCLELLGAGANADVADAEGEAP